MIVGIDEVGRGAWAGPLCVGAVVLGEDVQIDGLTDSKKLTAKKREQLTLEIKQQAAGIGLGWVSARKLDEIGLSAALKLAAARAIEQIACQYDQVIIDGTIDLLANHNLQSGARTVDVVTMKQADLLVSCVSAASVVAKVARDEYMSVMGRRFPGYGFEAHVGYGTAAHSQALAEFGATPIHRLSFAPLRKFPDEHAQKAMTNTRTGQIGAASAGAVAEARVAAYLVDEGYTIIDQNWKTKWCEIDIIAEKRGVVHFVEVKYRKSDQAGSGLAAITPKKLRQMKFAAELWLASHDVPRAVLSAVEVGGEEFVVTEFIEQIL